MNCKTCYKYLHLYRDGELNERQKQRVEIHCNRCSDCLALMRQIEGIDQSIIQLKEKVPTLDQPGLFTDQVMQAIRQGSINDRSAFHLNWLGFINRFSMRLAFGCILLLITTFFFYQEITIMHCVTVLESKIESATPIPTSTLGQCLSSLDQFEKSFFNGNMQRIISLVREGNIQEGMFNNYSKKFQTLSPVNQLKIIHLCRLAQEKDDHIKLYSPLKAMIKTGGLP